MGLWNRTPAFSPIAEIEYGFGDWRWKQVKPRLEICSFSRASSSAGVFWHANHSVPSLLAFWPFCLQNCLHSPGNRALIHLFSEMWLSQHLTYDSFRLTYRCVLGVDVCCKQDGDWKNQVQAITECLWMSFFILSNFDGLYLGDGDF